MVDTPLFIAVLFDRQVVVQSLIEAGADVNEVGGSNWTPLFVAAQYEHGVVVRLLIKAGADIQ